MPSALETLVKILKLERDQGYKDTAVIGGLSAFGEKWSVDAHNQARRPEHHLLVEELSTLLSDYEQIDNRAERHSRVAYMLDRIMGRVPPPPEFQPQASSPTLEGATESASQPPSVAPTVPAPPDHRPHSGERRHTRAGRQNAPQRESISAEDERHTDFTEAAPEGGGLEFIEDAPPKPRSGRSTRSARAMPAGELDIKPQPRLARPPRKPRPPSKPDEAAEILLSLDAPVETVKGVGPHMARLLQKLDIQTVNDLLFFLPRRYDDYTRLTYISRLQPNTLATVIGTVEGAAVRAGKNNRKDFVIVLNDGSGTMRVIFFGMHFLTRRIKIGHQLVLHGPISIYGHQLQMVNPEWEHLEASNLHTTGIVPVYPLTEGLGPRVLRRLMKQVVTQWAERLPDYMPEAVLERAELGDLGWTVRNLHFPEGWDHLRHARNRLIFDELLTLQLAILANRHDWQSVPGQPIQVSDDFLESFITAAFPYQLTGAQRRAIEDIRRDVSTATPMNRLLQGDVGSGKTAVATAAMAMAVVNGKQAALMAPTSILAEQHYRNIGAMLERMPGGQRPVIGLLTSALSATERQAIYNGLADRSIDVVIGTHALIQEGVEFRDLALAVIDEQHRFGVEQRGALRGKGVNPHLLVMTATPIPRTLALTIYADLDLSILDEKPPGRQPVQTRIVPPVERQRVYSFVEAQLYKGRQAFVVHPLVEMSEKVEAASAVEAYEDLKQVFFRHRVALLHGRMKPAEKDEVMSAFAGGEFDVLVTTSVAEVGVDIPNASVMVIEGANRFGLSQLHQFRGRVGRGEHTSYCLLVSDTDDAEAQERLHAMESTDDGFRLAEIDWKMRGAGDLVGTRQSGRHSMKLVAEMTPHMVELAQREARTIFAEDPTLSKPEHALLARRVGQLHHPTTDVS